MKHGLKDRVQARLTAIGKGPVEAATAAGMERTYIHDILEGKKQSVRVNKLEELARALDTTVGYLIGATEDQDGTRHPPNAGPPRPIPSFPMGTVPVYGSAKAGAEGVLILDGTIMARVPALPALESVPDAYAVFVAGDSMEPRYYPGETVYIHPTKPPRRGDFVVVQIHDQHGTTMGYVKRLVGYIEGDLVVSQFNPPKELRFPMQDVAKVELIVGSAQN